MNPLRPERARVRHEIGATVRLAMPLILAQLAAVGSNVIDTVLSGHVSAHVLGAVAVGANLWSLAIVCGIGMMMAVPPSVAQLDGAGRRHEVGGVFRQALWLALGMGALLWFAVRHAGPLIDLIGVAPSLRHDVERFLFAISWGAPALTCYFALRGLSEGLSLTRPSMVFGFGGLLLLVPLGYVLMFGKLGIPPQGAHGCGVATATVLWLEMLAFGFYVLRHRNYRGLGLFDHFERPHLRRIGALIRELRALPPNAAISRLVREHDLDVQAAENLLQFLADQANVTTTVPDDRNIVIERIRDELGDWRVCVLTPFGNRIHTPWAMAAAAQIQAAGGPHIETMSTDDGFVLRFPDVDEPPDPDLPANTGTRA